MPYLLDHCFFRQRPGWPDEADRWPIVPATTVITHLMGIAERAVPGMRAVAVHDVRLLKWIEAMPPVDVPVHGTSSWRADRVEVVADRATSRAVVELAAAHPAPPEPWPFDPATERVPELTARQLYDERWMFHGPRFQGVSELTAIGEHHVRGVLTAPAAPGALLDNVGQLLGYWIMSTAHRAHDRLPGPHGPASASTARSRGRASALDCSDPDHRASPTPRSPRTCSWSTSGRVWAELTGWQDRRFDTDPGIRAVDRFPGDEHALHARPGGWTLVHERWPDLATRDLIMRNMLGSAERATYDELAARAQAAVAARPDRRQGRGPQGAVGGERAGEIYPAEIAVHERRHGPPGRARACTAGGRAS